MISKKMGSALNVQVKEELFSAYLYLSMGAYFKHISLSGFAHWMLVQANEEDQHALKFMHYMFDRGWQVVLEPLPRPKSVWKSPLEVFQDVLKHEQKITEGICKLVDLAHSEKDYATGHMLQWFVKEQVEEEANVSEILAILKEYIRDSKSGLLFLDKKLAKRTTE